MKHGGFHHKNLWKTGGKFTCRTLGDSTYWTMKTMCFFWFCHEKLERRKVKGFGNCWLLHRERVRIYNNHVMLQVWLLEYPAVMHWMPWMLADFCGLQVDWKHGLFCSGRTASRPDMRLLNWWQYPLANLSKLVYVHVYIYLYHFIVTCSDTRWPMTFNALNHRFRSAPLWPLTTLDPPHMDGSILSIFLWHVSNKVVPHTTISWQHNPHWLLWYICEPNTSPTREKTT